MRKSEPSTGSRLLRAGIATAATTAIVVAGGATPASAASVPVVLSATAGSTTGGNTITAASTTAQAFLSPSATVNATFSIPACQATWNTAASTAVTPNSATVGNVPVTGGNAKKITSSKASILVPALPIAVTGTTSTKYNVCIYSGGAGAALAGTATYTVAVAPVFPNSGVITPASGPSLGGTRITVNATSGLPTTAGSITATLGGAPLTAITPISATSFTATTPARAPGTANLVVTTAAGAKTITGAFTYANGIQIEPNTAPRTSTAQIVDVLGAGFLDYTFGSSATNARVWLVDGQYDPGATAGTPATTYVVGPTAECTGVTVISDNELLCTLNLATGGLDPDDATALSGGAANVANGTYTLTVVSNGDIAASDSDGYLVTDISSGSTFTVAPY